MKLGTKLIDHMKKLGLTQEFLCLSNVAKLAVPLLESNMSDIYNIK